MAGSRRSRHCDTLSLYIDHRLPSLLHIEAYFLRRTGTAAGKISFVRFLGACIDQEMSFSCTTHRVATCWALGRLGHAVT